MNTNELSKTISQCIRELYIDFADFCDHNSKELLAAAMQRRKDYIEQLEYCYAIARTYQQRNALNLIIKQAKKRLESNLKTGNIWKYAELAEPRQRMIAEKAKKYGIKPQTIIRITGEFTASEAKLRLNEESH